MRLISAQLKSFLSDYCWTDKQLAEQLTLLGHEAELIKTGELEVKIFPNRGDCLSLYGMARELAAHYPKLGDLIEPQHVALPPEKSFFNLTITPAAESLVIADHLLKIENYKPTTSSAAIAQELRAIGFQPKDLLVDLTNLITHRWGLPLHVFDFDLVKNGLIIDRSREGEEVTLLNNQRCRLPKDLLIQRSDSRIVDLVGTMGALESAVNPTTTTVLVQAGVFDPTIIRRNSRETRIATEASYRYQRGVDTALCQIALEQFVAGIIHHRQFRVTNYQKFARPVKPVIVETVPENLSRILGIDVSTKNLEQLDRQGFSYHHGRLSVPSWRHDVRVIADVAEEVGRIIGLNTINPQMLVTAKSKISGEYYKQLAIKQALVKNGFTETATYSFVPSGGRLKLENPRTDEQAELRPALLPGLLETLAKNPYLKKALFFELGNVFLPDEQTHLGLVAAGYQEPQIKALAEKLGKNGLAIQFEAMASSELQARDVKHPRVWGAEVSLSNLRAKISYNDQKVSLPHYQLISRFPAIIRDVTLVINDNHEAKLDELIAKQTSERAPIIEKVDRYQSAEKLGDDHVAVTYRFFFQDLHRSLRDEDADRYLKKIVQNLAHQVKFEVS